VSAAVPLTWLYVPGDRPERVAKALASDADVVILDLEDAVSPGAKQAARATAAEVGASAERPLQVRVNAAGSPWAADDLAVVRELPSQVGVRLPKCADSVLVAAVAERVGERQVHLLIESALGVETAYDLARCHPRVASVGLGEADLRADLGATSDGGLLWARSRLVNAAAAAGLAPPSMSVFPDVRDLDGLARSSAHGRSLGFLGRAAIHPAQLPVIRAAFLPSEQELELARTVLTAAEEGEASGHGAVALPDGRFVDEAVVRQARRTLSLSDPP